MARVAVRLASILALTPLAVCVGGILAASSACSRPDAPPAPPPPTAAKLEQDLVDLALHDCFAADCERAYAHLAELPSGSPLRQSDAFRAVQYRYDADRLLRADVEQDLEKRRAALEAIASSRTAEASLRLGAAERISRLGVAPLRAGQELAVNALPGAATPAAIAAQEAAELLTKSRSQDPADQREVRARLEPRIYSGKGTPDDVAMLRVVCKAQHDDTCLHQLAHLILH